MAKQFLIIPFLFSVSLVCAQTKTLKNGEWRAVLERTDGNNIAFNFLVKDSAREKILYIKNANERLLVDDIKLVGDSIIIKLPFFETQLHVVQNTNELNGVYTKRLVDNYQIMPVHAYYQQDFRFQVSQNATNINITGRWAANFWSDNSKDTTPTVGEFVQHENNVTGTFLDPTGDYRYLQGVVDGDSLKLSAFDGGHAYLFTAKIVGDKMYGSHFSGPTFKNNWIAKRDDHAKLPDEFTLTKMKPGKSKLNFSFKDIDGKIVSLKDNRYKNKVVLIQIMGSWCPNCMDETGLLTKLYDQYKNKGIEVIGLAYERSTDFVRSQKSLRSFQKRFNVHYEILITGVSVNDSLRVQKTLPQLEDIVGFPTTIFIGKNGNVEKIHTGFNGPGTGEHYDEQKKEFYGIVDELLAK
ncbi:MAG TPA: TlpA disulfide reductase family protein [Puia sp.]